MEPHQAVDSKEKTVLVDFQGKDVWEFGEISLHFPIPQYQPPTSLETSNSEVTGSLSPSYPLLSDPICHPFGEATTSLPTSTSNPKDHKDGTAHTPSLLSSLPISRIVHGEDPYPTSHSLMVERIVGVLLLSPSSNTFLEVEEDADMETDDSEGLETDMELDDDMPLL